MSEPTLDESECPADPLELCTQWYNDALSANVPEPNAMTLATATPEGVPSARMVLLKGFDDRGFTFYTNYDSEKGRVLAANPRAALILFWAPLYRQIRVVGTVERVTEAESDAYFRSRPKGSRIAALASNQSVELPNRATLDERVEHLTHIYEAPDAEVPRPPYWGGFRVAPASIEFWQGRRDRLHDRLIYDDRDGASWKIKRLAP